ncbi:MAG: glycosyl transferase [Rhizobiaceae bacterium]
MSELWMIAIVAAGLSAALLFIVGKYGPATVLVAPVGPRSNHATPTPQTGGLAVVPAMLIAILAGWVLGVVGSSAAAAISVSIVMLFAAGIVDDARDIGAVAKLVIQIVAASISVYGFSDTLSIFPSELFFPIAGLMTIILLVWAINLTNFMDGLDLMVVAGIGLPALVVGLGGLAGYLELSASVVISLALGCALLPFGLANRPVARMFLGDNGSLPVGLVAGVIFLGLSVQYSIFVGCLPFSYFIIDTAATLAARLARRENILAAHSQHAYQTARRAGLQAITVSGLVALVSLLGAVLAIASATGYVTPLAGFIITFGAACALYLILKTVSRT